MTIRPASPGGCGSDQRGALSRTDARLWALGRGAGVEAGRVAPRAKTTPRRAATGIRSPRPANPVKLSRRREKRLARPRGRSRPERPQAPPRSSRPLLGPPVISHIATISSAAARQRRLETTATMPVENSTLIWASTSSSRSLTPAEVVVAGAAAHRCAADCQKRGDDPVGQVPG